MARRSWTARQNIQAYELENGRAVYILAEGRLVNLASGDGHPAEIMDMSFAIQVLSARWLLQNLRPCTRKDGDMLIRVPEEINRDVAMRELAVWGVSTDTLTPEQRKYLYGE